MTNAKSRTGDPGGVLIVGYGHFGEALATLLTEAGVEVSAVDPHVRVPAHFTPPATWPDASVRFVFLCVPVWAFTGVLEELRPRLSPDHVVVDVSSVRHGPETAMRAVLGTEIPWVGTHPLFGPSSVARGERPLRAVVSPNDLHPQAVEDVVSLYRRLGWSVKMEAADDHDRRMAYSHALAFFVAKGLMDIDAPTAVDFVPPSFRAFIQTIDSVRSDAGHLFLSIQNLNPHAVQARADLLDGLSRLHDELEIAEREHWDEPQGPALSIPDLGSAAPELRETRDLIDDVDRELVRIIARRAQLARRAGRIKKEHGSGIRDPGRENEVLEARRAWAASEDLDPAAVARVFEALMALARGEQAP